MLGDQTFDAFIARLFIMIASLDKVTKMQGQDPRKQTQSFHQSILILIVANA
jgi:hypothetical protein